MLEPVQQPPKEQVDKTKGAVIIDGTTYVAGKPVVHHGQPWEIYPRESDVILGRGNGVAQHAGNVQFRRYCWALRGKYNRAYRYVTAVACVSCVLSCLVALDCVGLRWIALCWIIYFFYVLFRFQVSHYKSIFRI